MNTASLLIPSVLALALCAACGTRTGLPIDERVGDGGIADSTDASDVVAGDAVASDVVATQDAEGGTFNATPMLALGSYHTCALRWDGRVLCWGGNHQGQLGDGTTTDRATPAEVSLPSAAVVALVAGFRHTCAALVTGDVYCWGENINGQVAPDADSIVTSPVRVALDAVGVGGVVGLAAGENHTCAALSDGRLLCWGSNRQGQLGMGMMPMDVPPNDVPLAGAVVQVSAGDFFTCAVVRTKGSDEVWCFGQNFYGQLGDGTYEDRMSPVRAVLDTPVQKIDLGGFFVLASLQGDGHPALRGWGDNAFGQLGPDVGYSSAVPVEITPSWNLIDFSAGLGHSCALLWHDEEPNEPMCWGANGHGQLGDGTTTMRAEPAAVAIDLAGSEGPVLIEAGLLHTCLELLEGDVYCWGSNEFGQLGDGTSIDSYVPTRVHGL